MSRTTIERVRQFHQAFGQKDQISPRVPAQFDRDTISDYATDLAEIAKGFLENSAGEKDVGGDPLPALRLHLITEELSELADALAWGDIVGCLDALTDLQYVIDGTYLALGLSELKEDAFEEVHRSNMSKLGADGKPVLNEAGRVLKGPNYFKPNLEAVVEFYQLEKTKKEG